MSDYCFVCLNKSRNKICSTCKCYAHPSCWGNYLKNSTDVFTFVYHGSVIISTPFYTQCPQCRSNIGSVKSITRSDTYLARKLSLFTHIRNKLFAVDLTESKEEKETILNDIFDKILRNKVILKDEKIFNNMISTKLIDLYEKEGWKPANMYYNQIFGKQLLR